MPRTGVLLLLSAAAAVVDGAGVTPTTNQVVGVADLTRALTRIPHANWRGNGFVQMNEVLNSHLRRKRSLSTFPCSEFTVEMLQENVLTCIWDRVETSLLDIYTITNDPRQRLHATLDSVRESWQQMNSITAESPRLREVQRDGLCHEAVMWFVHHLTMRNQKELEGTGFTLPLLPEHHHDSLGSPDGGSSKNSTLTLVNAEYEARVSCQQCHSGPTRTSDPDATLMPPYAPDAQQPGLERKRECHYLYDPPCHPCEGLGGPRAGDGVHDFLPVNCSVVAEAMELSEDEQPPPTFPAMGSSKIHGDARDPLTVRFDPKKPGRYHKSDMTINLAWDDQMYRMRYVFDNVLLNKSMVQLYLHAPQQARDGNSSGAMVTILADQGYCECTEAIAGIMHIGAFVPHEALDPLDLPSDQGGSTYLGRIKLDTIDDGFGNRTVIADHWMKWAFHFLVDADPYSPSYRQPVRLYASSGVRLVYSEWSLDDPRIQDPELFNVPKHCIVRTNFCKQLQRDTISRTPVEVV